MTATFASPSVELTDGKENRLLSEDPLLMSLHEKASVVKNYYAFELEGKKNA